MNQTRSNLGNACPGCGEFNEPGMLFCMNCGQALPASSPASPEGAKGGAALCPSCGTPDELGHAFCVNCGQSMGSQPPASQGSTTTKATAQSGMQSLRQQPPPVSQKKAKPAAKPPRSFTAIATLLGIAAGAAAAYIAQETGVLNLITPLPLPPHGLVIFANPPQVDVEVAERTGRSFTAGRTGKTGCLSLPDLPAGYYRLTLTAPDRVPVVKDIQVEADRPALLGYPKRLELPQAR